MYRPPYKGASLGQSGYVPQMQSLLAFIRSYFGHSKSVWISQRFQVQNHACSFHEEFSVSRFPGLIASSPNRAENQALPRLQNLLLSTSSFLHHSPFDEFRLTERLRAGGVRLAALLSGGGVREAEEAGLAVVVAVALLALLLPVDRQARPEA